MILAKEMSSKFHYKFRLMDRAIDNTAFRFNHPNNPKGRSQKKDPLLLVLFLLS